MTCFNFELNLYELSTCNSDLHSLSASDSVSSSNFRTCSCSNSTRSVVSLTDSGGVYFGFPSSSPPPPFLFGLSGFPGSLGSDLPLNKFEGRLDSDGGKNPGTYRALDCAGCDKITRLINTAYPIE